MEVPYSQKLFGLIPWYSVLIVIGIALSVWLMNREAVRKGLPADTGIDIALWAVPFGIIGARLYFVLFRWEDYADHLISVLYIWEGGLAIYGAVIGGMLGILLYSRRKKIPFALLLDIVTPGLILAQAIGRWGNYFNMEAYGPILQNASLHFFPIGVLIQGSEWHMATFFYESCWNFACFFVLIWLRRRCRKNGQVFLWYFLLYGSGRFIIEQLREDSLYFAGLRVSQWLSLFMCLLAITLLLKDTITEKKQMLFIPASILLLCRWFLTAKPVYSGLCLLFSCILIVCSIRREMIPLVLAFGFADGSGHLLAVNSLVQNGQFSILLMGLFCSITLCAQQILMFLSKKKATEGS